MGPARDGVAPLLDLGFGFYAWAMHLLLVYTSTAIACQIGLGADTAGQPAFRAWLVAITVVAIAMVVLHAARRYRAFRGLTRRRFRMSVTLGADAIATVAIAWQLVAVLMMPLCA